MFLNWCWHGWMSSSLFQKWTLRRSVARPRHSGNTGSDPAAGAANLTVTSNKSLITSHWSIRCVPTCHISLRRALSHYDRGDPATAKVELHLNDDNKAACARECSIQQGIFSRRTIIGSTFQEKPTLLQDPEVSHADEVVVHPRYLAVSWKPRCAWKTK